MMQKAWSVTRGGAVYKFDGSSWTLKTQLYAASGILPGRCFIRVFNVDNDVWIGAGATSGGNYTRMHHWNGSSWTYNDLADTTLTKFWGSSTNSIWATGSNAGAGDYRFWYWNGSSWSNVFTLVKSTYGEKYLIDGGSASEIWTGGGAQTAYGDKSFYRYNGATWSIDDSATLGDGARTDVGSFSIFHDGSQFYLLTNTAGQILKLYTRSGIGTGSWNYHSTLENPCYVGSGNLNFGKCFFSVGTKLFAAVPNEGSYGKKVYFKDGAGAWSDIVPAAVERLMCIDGDSAGNVWIGGTKNVAGNSTRALWYRDAITGSWSEYVIAYVAGEDNWICDVDVDYLVDLTAPYVDSKYPAAGTRGIDIDVIPSFNLKDNETGVNTATTKIWVEGSLIYDGGVSSSGWTVSRTTVSGGYKYTLNHSTSFAFKSEITVRVYGEDLASTPNTVDTSWTFNTNDEPRPGEGYYCTEILDGRDYSISSSGKLTRDYTIASRARMRLLARRGEWLYDPTMGSRFHTIKRQDRAEADCAVFAVEALQPLINEGEIIKVEIGEIDFDAKLGALAVEIFITTPNIEERISLGKIKIGA